MDAFSQYHPLVNLALFGTVFLCTCLCSHPICLILAFFAGALYYVLLKGRRVVGLLLKWVLPLMVFAAVLNPLFSHAGATILWYFPSGNPLTAESIFYGISAGVTVGVFLLWFACFSVVFTTDKLIYVFGRLAPALSVVISMILRFVPRFKQRFDALRQMRGTPQGALAMRIKGAVACFSMAVTWSLENAIETADSMRSRGYGLGRRSTYTRFRFTSRDGAALCLCLLPGFFLLCGGIGGLQWRYYPTVRGVLTEPLTVALLCAYGALCFAPAILEGKERRRWKHS